MNWIAVASLALALLVPLVAWIAVIRKAGGRIQTSEASDLWTAQAQMRTDLTTQLLQERERSVNLEVRMAKAETSNNSLVQENWSLQRKIADLEGVVARQAETITALQALVKAQREALESGP